MNKPTKAQMRAMEELVRKRTGISHAEYVRNGLLADKFLHSSILLARIAPLKDWDKPRD